MREPDPLERQSCQGKQGSALPVPPSLGRDPLPSPPESGPTTDEEGQSVAYRPAPPSDVEDKREFATFSHEYIREYIALADQKATFFFTGATALLAFLYNKDISARWLKPVMQWNILDTVAFFAMTFTALGSFLALLVVIPRTPGSRRGFLFWEAIAEYDSGRQYSDDLLSLSPTNLVQIRAEHCYDLARVCRRKYSMLRLALWCGAAGLAGSLLVFLFL